MSLSPVSTANILLSTNKANLDRFIDTGKIEAGKGSHIFSSKNTNFLSIEHVMDLERDGIAGFSIKLKIQDPTSTFMENFIPATVMDVIHQELSEIPDKKIVDFYIMYGVGPNTTRHWAGPFICNIFSFDHYSTDGGADIIDMVLMALLPLQANLTLQQIDDVTVPDRSVKGVARTYMSTTFGKSTNDLISSSKIGDDSMAVDIQKINVPLGVSSKRVQWTAKPDDVLDGIRKLYTNYAKAWGISNFLMYLTQDFKDILISKSVSPSEFVVAGAGKRLGGGTISASTSARVSSFQYVSDMKRFFAPFGIRLIDSREEVDSKAYTTNPISSPPPGSASRSTAYTLKVDLMNDLKVSKTCHFFEAFNRFYQHLGNLTANTMKPQVFVENNPIILKYIKERASVKGKIIVDENQPLVLVGERNLLRNELANFGQVALIVRPLPDETLDPDPRGLLEQYYVNKIFRRFNNHYFLDLDKSVNDLTYKEAELPDQDEVPLVFEANTDKANITSYNFDANLFTLAAVKRSIGFIDASKEELEAYIFKVLSKLAENESYFDLPEVSKKLTDLIIQNSTDKASGFHLSVPFPGGWKTVIKNYLQYFYSVAVQSGTTGTIRTVPYFQLSDQFILGTPCDVRIKQSPSLEDYPNITSLQDTFYNGRYNIIGVKHVITANDAYSEFKLLKMALPAKNKTLTQATYAIK